MTPGQNFVENFEQRIGRKLKEREGGVLAELAGNLLRELNFQKELNGELIKEIS